MEAGNACDLGDVVECQGIGEVAFNKPQRLLRGIHGITTFLRSAVIMPSRRTSRFTVLALPRLQTAKKRSGCEKCSQAAAGNAFPIVHTAGAFDPTAPKKAAQQETARAIGQARQGGR